MGFFPLGDRGLSRWRPDGLGVRRKRTPIPGISAQSIRDRFDCRTGRRPGLGSRGLCWWVAVATGLPPARPVSGPYCGAPEDRRRLRRRPRDDLGRAGQQPVSLRAVELSRRGQPVPGRGPEYHDLRLRPSAPAAVFRSRPRLRRSDPGRSPIRIAARSARATERRRNHPGRAISLDNVRWSGHDGQLILAPSYPGGGEVGSHLVFSYRSGGIYRGISLHPWPSQFLYRVSGVEHTVKLAPNPAYPRILATLRAIVRSAN